METVLQTHTQQLLSSQFNPTLSPDLDLMRCANPTSRHCSEDYRKINFPFWRALKNCKSIHLQLISHKKLHFLWQTPMKGRRKRTFIHCARAQSEVFVCDSINCSDRILSAFHCAQGSCRGRRRKGKSIKPLLSQFEFTACDKFPSTSPRYTTDHYACLYWNLIYHLRKETIAQFDWKGNFSSHCALAVCGVEVLTHRHREVGKYISSSTGKIIRLRLKVMTGGRPLFEEAPNLHTLMLRPYP